MTDKKVADADKRQAEREATAAHGKERAEQVGTKDGKGTPADPIVIDEPKKRVDEDGNVVEDRNFIENTRYGVKVEDD